MYFTYLKQQQTQQDQTLEAKIAAAVAAVSSTAAPLTSASTPALGECLTPHLAVSVERIKWPWIDDLQPFWQTTFKKMDF